MASVTDSAVPPAAEPSITTVEHRGIEYIPRAARWGKPSGLFWMWAGAVWNVEFVVYGALAVVVFGLSFAQAVVMILIGNLFYLLTGLASLQGPEAGTTTFTISRAAFGPRGNKLPSLFNWVTQVGFEIEGIALIVFAAILLTSKAGFTAGTALKIVFLLLAIAVQAVLPLLGHAAVLRVLRWLTIPFVVLFVIMAIITASKFNVHAAHHGASWGSLLIFLAVVIAAGGLGWTENGNDYSRYLPPTASKRNVVLAVALGGAIPSVARSVICTGVAAYAVFSTQFYGLLTSFLLFIILWLAPWCAIYLVDSWLRKNRYDHEGLFDENGGRYFRNGGFHWPALIAQIGGGVAAALWLNAFSETALSYEGPLASRIGGSFGSDLSVFIGLMVGGVLYWLLASRTVRAEGEATPEPAS